MEFYDEIENTLENNCENCEKTESTKGITEDFLERLEKEKINDEAINKSKAIAFGSLDDVDYNLEKFNKTKEEYDYRVKILGKSISEGENSFNEKLDAEYAERAMERAKTDLEYAEKYHSK